MKDFDGYHRCPDLILPGEGEVSFLNQPFCSCSSMKGVLFDYGFSPLENRNSLPPTEEFSLRFLLIPRNRNVGSGSSCTSGCMTSNQKSCVCCSRAFWISRCWMCYTQEGVPQSGNDHRFPPWEVSENHRLKSAKRDGICDRSQEFFLVKGSSRVPIWKDVLRFIG